MNKYLALTFLVFSGFCLCNAQALKLNAQQLKEAKELILLIDVVDQRLQYAWNPKNDNGLATEKDNIYFDAVQNVAPKLTKRIMNLPAGSYSDALIVSVMGYYDVGEMRTLSNVKGGYNQQLKIAKRYNIQNRDPHMWAAAIWRYARHSRNIAATSLGLPINKYPE